MTQWRLSTIWTLVMPMILSGCYTFKNASVPVELEYFFVEDFRITALNAPATIDTDFEEALKNKIRSESRLELNREEAQVIFSGSVSSYQVQALAPQPGQTVQLNRLNIGITIDYLDLSDEEKNWSQTFREYAEYSSDQVLADIEEELIRTIFEQITENVFNKSFGDW